MSVTGDEDYIHAFQIEAVAKLITKIHCALPEAYLVPYQTSIAERFKEILFLMEPLVKRTLVANYFHKKLHQSCLTVFQIHPYIRVLIETCCTVCSSLRLSLQSCFLKMRKFFLLLTSLILLMVLETWNYTIQKMKFPVKDFFSKDKKIHKFLCFPPDLLKFLIPDTHTYVCVNKRCALNHASMV